VISSSSYSSIPVGDLLILLLIVSFSFSIPLDDPLVLRVANRSKSDQIDIIISPKILIHQTSYELALMNKGREMS